MRFFAEGFHLLLDKLKMLLWRTLLAFFFHLLALLVVGLHALMPLVVGIGGLLPLRSMLVHVRMMNAERLNLFGLLIVKVTILLVHVRALAFAAGGLVVAIFVAVLVSMLVLLVRLFMLLFQRTSDLLHAVGRLVQATLHLLELRLGITAYYVADNVDLGAVCNVARIVHNALRMFLELVDGLGADTLNNILLIVVQLVPIFFGLLARSLHHWMVSYLGTVIFYFSGLLDGLILRFNNLVLHTGSHVAALALDLLSGLGSTLSNLADDLVCAGCGNAFCGLFDDVGHLILLLEDIVEAVRLMLLEMLMLELGE